MGTESPSGSWLSRLPCRRNEIKTLEIQIELMQNTVRRLTETEVNSSTYQEQVRDRGVPQSYPDEWLELCWIRPGQTSLTPLQCRRREKEKGYVLHLYRCYTHTHTQHCHTPLFHPTCLAPSPSLPPFPILFSHLLCDHEKKLACGVIRSFSFWLRPPAMVPRHSRRLPPLLPQSSTHNLLTHNLLAHNLLTHNFFTPNLSTHSLFSHTTYHNLLTHNLLTHLPTH